VPGRAWPFFNTQKQVADLKKLPFWFDLRQGKNYPENWRTACLLQLPRLIIQPLPLAKKGIPLLACLILITPMTNDQRGKFFCPCKMFGGHLPISLATSRVYSQVLLISAY